MFSPGFWRDTSWVGEQKMHDDSGRLTEIEGLTEIQGSHVQVELIEGKIHEQPILRIKLEEKIGKS